MSKFFRSILTVSLLTATFSFGQAIDWSADTIRISNVSQFVEFINVANNNQNSGFENQVIILLSDINLEGIDAISFGIRLDLRGTFDGRGNVISGFQLNDAYGFFRAIGPSGAVRNLGLEGRIHSRRPHAGGLTGANNGIISNSYFIGHVQGFAGATIGGLVGINSGLIQNSYSRAQVFPHDGSQNVGGLVGLNNNGSGRVENSYFAGIISNSPRYYLYNSDNQRTEVAQNDLRQRQTFVGWNFNVVWTSAPEQNEGFPFLRVFQGGSLSGLGTRDNPLQVTGTTFATEAEFIDFLRQYFFGDLSQAQQQEINIELSLIEEDEPISQSPQTRSSALIRYRLYLLLITSENPDIDVSNADGIYVRAGFEGGATSILNRPVPQSRRYGILLDSAVVQNSARISVITPEVSRVSVRIFNALGNLIYETSGHSNEPIVWNLVNRNGQLVASGAYLIIAEAHCFASGRRFVYRSKIGVRR